MYLKNSLGNIDAEVSFDKILCIFPQIFNAFATCGGQHVALTSPVEHSQRILINGDKRSPIRLPSS